MDGVVQAVSDKRHEIKLSPSVLFMALLWWLCYLEREQQRTFLFLVFFFKLAEYFYFLADDLQRYQTEPWWDVPKIPKVLGMLVVFWTVAWLTAQWPMAAQDQDADEKLGLPGEDDSSAESPEDNDSLIPEQQQAENNNEPHRR
ncbi:expressed unknown protein [Seminavis robusta]|uniref:Uncharacterized protein n=1 Tax=Seminavis robusta TaxID=568900 RepID=A0A9N8DU21_9STRA|nr:expressed unknown protein [Seminavis robusta]|eukprot:Sro275_g105760.1 n/a (144) ;mRNA; f:51414-51845